MKHRPLLLVSALGLLLLVQNNGARAWLQNQNGVPATQAAEAAEAEQLATQVVKLYNDRKYDQALPLAQRLLELRQRTVGADHFLTGQALENLAELFLAKGKLKDAESYYEKAIPIFEKSAPEKRNVIVLLERYACVYAGDMANEKLPAIRERAVAGKSVVPPKREEPAETKGWHAPLFKLYNGHDRDEMGCELLKLPFPEIPMEARLNHTRGGVVTKVTVSETGKVIKVQILCGNPVLARAAALAASGARFKPASIAGKPIQFFDVIIYRFA